MSPLTNKREFVPNLLSFPCTQKQCTSRENETTDTQRSALRKSRTQHHLSKKKTSKTSDSNAPSICSLSQSLFDLDKQVKDVVFRTPLQRKVGYLHAAHVVGSENMDSNRRSPSLHSPLIFVTDDALPLDFTVSSGPSPYFFVRSNEKDESPEPKVSPTTKGEDGDSRNGRRASCSATSPLGKVASATSTRPLGKDSVGACPSLPSPLGKARKDVTAGSAKPGALPLGKVGARRVHHSLAKSGHTSLDLFTLSCDETGVKTRRQRREEMQKALFPAGSIANVPLDKAHVASPAAPRPLGKDRRTLKTTDPDRRDSSLGKMSRSPAPFGKVSLSPVASPLDKVMATQGRSPLGKVTATSASTCAKRASSRTSRVVSSGEASTGSTRKRAQVRSSGVVSSGEAHTSATLSSRACRRTKGEVTSAKSLVGDKKRVPLHTSRAVSSGEARARSQKRAQLRPSSVVSSGEAHVSDKKRVSLHTSRVVSSGEARVVSTRKRAQGRSSDVVSSGEARVGDKGDTKRTPLRVSSAASSGEALAGPDRRSRCSPAVTCSGRRLFAQDEGRESDVFLFPRVSVSATPLRPPHGKTGASATPCRPTGHRDVAALPVGTGKDLRGPPRHEDVTVGNRLNVFPTLPRRSPESAKRQGAPLGKAQRTPPARATSGPRPTRVGVSVPQGNGVRQPVASHRAAARARPESRRKTTNFHHGVEGGVKRSDTKRVQSKHMKVLDALRFSRSTVPHDVIQLLEEWNRRGNNGKGWAPTTLQTWAGHAIGACAKAPLYGFPCTLSLTSDPLFKQWLRALEDEVLAFDVNQSYPLTKEELLKILLKAKENKEWDVVACLQLLWATTQRVSCVLKLRRHNVHLKGTSLKAKFVEGKGVKARRSPYTVHSLCQRYPGDLARYLRASQDMFLFPFPEKTRAKLLKRAKEVNPKIECRSFRRGSLQTMAMANVDVETLLHFSGHTNLKMLLRYLNWGWHWGLMNKKGEKAATHLW